MQSNILFCFNQLGAKNITTKTTSLNAGFTLLELLLAGTLSSLLIIMLMTSYSLIAKNFTNIHQLEEIVTAGNQVFYFLSQQLAFTNNGIPIDSVFAINEASYPFLKLCKGTQGFGITKLSGNQPQQHCFYLSHTEQKQSAFFYKEGSKPRIMVAPNIVDMQVLYGLKCHYSNNICDYVAAVPMGEGALVTSVQLTLTFLVNDVMKKTWRAYFAVRPYQVSG